MANKLWLFGVHFNNSPMLVQVLLWKTNAEQSVVLGGTSPQEFSVQLLLRRWMVACRVTICSFTWMPTRWKKIWWWMKAQSSQGSCAAPVWAKCVRLCGVSMWNADQQDKGGFCLGFPVIYCLLYTAAVLNSSLLISSNFAATFGKGETKQRQVRREYPGYAAVWSCLFLLLNVINTQV